MPPGAAYLHSSAAHSPGPPEAPTAPRTFLNQGSWAQVPRLRCQVPHSQPSSLCEDPSSSRALLGAPSLAQWGPGPGGDAAAHDASGVFVRAPRSAQWRTGECVCVGGGGGGFSAARRPLPAGQPARDRGGCGRQEPRGGRARVPQERGRSAGRVVTPSPAQSRHRVRPPLRPRGRCAAHPRARPCAPAPPARPAVSPRACSAAPALQRLPSQDEPLGRLDSLAQPPAALPASPRLSSETWISAWSGEAAPQSPPPPPAPCGSSTTSLRSRNPDPHLPQNTNPLWGEKRIRPPQSS
uniref:Uncharacterized protein n=1 Tax=Myotis myotis TaxID=51298 RepID=A0A7J7Y085_MYOMY|nr:hypothetical protein mMyoMyo1_011539 [Myotis myotis]